MLTKNKSFLLISALILVYMSMNSFKNKERWKFGVALYSFHQHSFQAGLDMAVRSGVKNIEGFSFQKLGDEFGDRTLQELNINELQRIKEMLKERGLKMPSLYVSAKGVKEWESYFKMGKILEVDYFVSEPDQRELASVDSLAGLYNIKVAIHQHARPGVYWHPDSVLDAIHGRDNLGACADVGHWVRSGVNPVKGIETLAGKIIGIHLKDVNREGNDVAFGEGEIDFSKLINELKKQKYSGYLNVECEYNWDDNSDDIKESIRYFNEIK